MCGLPSSHKCLFFNSASTASVGWALLVGDAETVAKKIIYVNEVLGGLSRIPFQMGVSTLPHQKMLRSIEILGTHVAPIMRKEFSVTLPRP